MTVRIAKDVRTEALPKLYAMLGCVLEHVAANREVREAVEFVLGYEEDVLRYGRDPEAMSNLPADIAHAKSMLADGEERGLARAFQTLCDGDYIIGRRELIEKQIEEARSNVG